MKTKQVLTAAAFASLMTMSLGAQAADAPTTEKCYGVSKAGKNDCGANGHACAGIAVKDGDATEWLMMPTGLCEKLVNGNLTAPAGSPAEEHEHTMEAPVPTPAPMTEEKK